MRFNMLLCLFLLVVVLSGVPGSSALQAAIVDPNQISGSVLWLDASDASTVVDAAHSGFVQQWTDKSTAGGGTVSQANFSNKPQTGVNALHGKNVLTFGGATDNDFLTGAAVVAGGDDTYSVYAVWKPRVNQVQVVVEQAADPVASSARASLLHANTTYGFNGQGNDRHNLVPVTADAWRSTAMAINNDITIGRSSVHNVRITDNGELYSGRTANPGSLNVGNSGVRVGGKLATGTERFDGDLAEIVIFNRDLMGTTAHYQMLHYLDTKWGLNQGTVDYQAVHDFENGVLPDGWTTTGTAFGTQPTNSVRANFNKQGEWFLGTFEDEQDRGTGTQGDGQTGTLTGTPFVLESNTIQALIGGGGWDSTADGKTQLQLEHEASPGVWVVARKDSGHARTSSSAQGEPMREYEWNVDNLVGQTVRFKVVDERTGSWGHVNVDSIRVLDAERARTLHTSFDGATLDAHLSVYRPGESPTATLAGTGQFQFVVPHIASQPLDLWSTINRAPQLRLAVNNDLYFSLETRLTRADLSNGSHTGLLLSFVDPDGDTWDPIMFGPIFTGGTPSLRMEGPFDNGGPLDALVGMTIDEIFLRITRSDTLYDFLYSFDGRIWTSIGTRDLGSRDLDFVGLFAKGFGGTVTSEFDYLQYSAVPEPSSWLLSALGALALIAGVLRHRRRELGR